MNTSVSGVGVIDKSVAVLDALERQPSSLAELVAATQLSRPTVHRLAVALEHHGLVRRRDDGRFALGYRFLAFARAIDDLGPLVDAARPHLDRLSRTTGESAQLYVRDGAERVCVAAAESPHGLRTIVDVGARLTLERGSAGAVLRGEALDGVAVSIGEREPGVASVSVAVVVGSDPSGAALSVSGPIDRMSDDPGGRFAELLRAEAEALGRRLADQASMATTSTVSTPPGAS